MYLSIGMKSFQSSLTMAFAPNKSSHAHATLSYYRQSCGTHRKISSNIVCSKNNNENFKRDNSSGLTQADLSSRDVIACKDIVVDDIMGRTTTTATRLEESCTGIGISKFLQGKNYFITGATGLLAKVFIEKLLRTTPDVGKIFLLIKAKHNQAAMDRLKNEIVDSELFKCLEEKHGKAYKAFMLSKLIPIVGNVCESNLGMDDDLAREIAKQVNVIVNSAANTNFHERYDIALNTNTKGPCRLLSFAKKCTKLNIFLHVSTAYVNGERKGIILEKPFRMGESIARERLVSESLPVLDVDAEIKLALDVRETVEENATTQKMIDLGLERARMYGWQNTYVFTKAMGEMLINNLRGDIPIVVIRPSIIESTCIEPFPGWIQGNRMLDPVLLSYGKGQLPGFYVDRNQVLDIVPADMVVNATMAAMAKHGNVGRPGLSLYHVASSVVNPIEFQDIMELCREYFTASPFMDSQGKRINVSGMKFFNSIDCFSLFMCNEIIGQSETMESAVADKTSRRLKIKCRRVVDFAIQLAKLYAPYTFFQARFDNGNTLKLMEDMSEEELNEFGFDTGSIDWKDYLLNVHLPGLTKHVMKGRLASG